MRRDDGETVLALFVDPGWVPRKLGRSNRSSVHFDQHLATTRHRAGNRFIDQSVPTTSMMAANRDHCLSCFHDRALQDPKVTSASTEKEIATSMPQPSLPKPRPPICLSSALHFVGALQSTDTSSKGNANGES